MKTRIGILGIGGVGGYFGGKLAKKYFNNPDIEILFIAREETANIISANGLKIIEEENEQVIRPTLVTSNIDEIGELDYLICSTKTYDIENSLTPLRKVISEKTIILPLYNGVDAKPRIETLFPNNTVLNGCVYIVAFKKEKGVILKKGKMHHLYFGSSHSNQSKMEKLQNIFLDANIKSSLLDNIETRVWSKYIFISSIASLTSYTDLTIGQIFESEAHTKTLENLIDEGIALANAKNIELPEDLKEKTLSQMRKQALDTTTSMQRDFRDGGKTEVESLTGYIVKESDKFNLNSFNFTTLYKELTQP